MSGTDACQTQSANEKDGNARKRQARKRLYVLETVRFGGRDGIRTHDLLIANEGKSKIRCGTTIT